jgi:hypothetical protein
MKVTLKQAAHLTGVDESKIWKHMRHGWLPAKKDPAGEYWIETEDLFRVFPPVEILSAEKIEAQVTRVQEEIPARKSDPSPPDTPRVRQSVPSSRVVSQPQPQPPDPKRKAKRRGLTYSLILLILVILGCLVMLSGTPYSETIKHEWGQALIHVLDRLQESISLLKDQLDDSRRK